MIINKKVCIIGGFAVGKTSLVRRYVLSEFSPDYQATLGVNIYKYTDSVEMAGKGKVQVNQVIWDVEGNTTRREMLENYVRGSAGALIVGDVTRPDSIADMRTHAELFKRIAPGRPMVFAYNKIDLLDGPWEESGDELIYQYGGLSIQTSAATGHQVQDLFRSLAGRILEIGA